MAEFKPSGVKDVAPDAVSARPVQQLPHLTSPAGCVVAASASALPRQPVWPLRWFRSLGRCGPVGLQDARRRMPRRPHSPPPSPPSHALPFPRRLRTIPDPALAADPSRPQFIKAYAAHLKSNDKVSHGSLWPLCTERDVGGRRTADGAPSSGVCRLRRPLRLRADGLPNRLAAGRKWYRLHRELWQRLAGGTAGCCGGGAEPHGVPRLYGG
eukprot:363881-Chlamydomonas_euryale.AAC.7